MGRGKRRRGWTVYPGGVIYPSRRQAKRVMRVAGGSTGRMEGPGGGCLRFLGFLAVCIGVIAVVMYLAGVLG